MRLLILYSTYIHLRVGFFYFVKGLGFNLGHIAIRLTDSKIPKQYNIIRADH